MTTGARVGQITYIKVPHLPNEQQIELKGGELRKPWTDGKPPFDRIVGAKGCSMGQGDMPMEFLQAHSKLSVSPDSRCSDLRHRRCRT